LHGGLWQSMSATKLLHSASLALLAGLATGYGIGARVASRRLRGGTSPFMMAGSAPPADAVSMKSAGLCAKLTVPSDLLDKTDVFIFDCDGVIVTPLRIRRCPATCRACHICAHSEPGFDRRRSRSGRVTR